MPDPATNPPAEIADAVQWTCDRTVRKFAALATLPDGEILTGFYSVRTPSCAQRFELDASRRVDTGKKFKVRAVDQWGLGGVKPRLCVAPPGAKLDCRELRLQGRRRDGAAARSAAAVAGRWRVELRQGDKVRRQTTVLVGAGRAAAEVKPPIVLATGDSTMQGIDSFLTDRLGDDAVVHSDIYPGAGSAAASSGRARPSSRRRPCGRA